MERYTQPRPSSEPASAATDDLARIRGQITLDRLWSVGTAAADPRGQQLSLDEIVEHARAERQLEATAVTAELLGLRAQLARAA